ncbi:MarR family winged helix-turn-helix transcriptional regulator [Chakrabartyella piscis]|uniref:MarR family winged helix-turn-helix transcriptional regulator n=1 Tax=Chakrabartyella piscis TaxID=2918914 RepID=UPI00295836FA|nr:MarR family winged helix-turn-helix transcriptional regulator [Chakrabartyella piscis]
MENKKTTLEMIKTVHLAKREIDNVLSKGMNKEVSVPQAHVISFVFDRSKADDVFQKDIEEAFELHRSSVSLMISNMEKNGLIKREPVKEDARLRKIVLTEKALQQQAETERLIAKANEKILENITVEEEAALIHILKKIQRNLK